MAKQQISATFDDTCTVYVESNVTDPKTHRTTKSQKAVYTDIPCRLSFSSVSVDVAMNADRVSQSVKLFVAPDVSVPAGSKIHVKQRSGRETDWKRSGLPASYMTHQEIMLEPYEVHA